MSVDFHTNRGAGGVDSGAFYLDLPDEGDYRLSILTSGVKETVSVSVAFDSDEIETWVYASLSPGEARELAFELTQAAERLETEQ